MTATAFAAAPSPSLRAPSLALALTEGRGMMEWLASMATRPLMMQAPGVKACTRYKLEYSDTGDVPDYLAVYAIDNVERPRTPEWKAQTNKGAWPTQMRPHFTARRNGVYQRVSVIKEQ